MKNFKLGLKRKALNKDVQRKDAVNASVQPSKEVPSINNKAQVNADRIDAHDLFSHYTADIIKEETVFFR
ncbi:hypothetical protein [Haliscomenobacter sp.]|uniref:hypothetical protein n=1 Tax=Haliscomenobacter sp. TaxID=2717303 RepID=UPI003594034A